MLKGVRRLVKHKFHPILMLLSERFWVRYLKAERQVKIGLIFVIREALGVDIILSFNLLLEFHE